MDKWTAGQTYKYEFIGPPLLRAKKVRESYEYQNFDIPSDILNSFTESALQRYLIGNKIGSMTRTQNAQYKNLYASHYTQVRL